MCWQGKIAKEIEGPVAYWSLKLKRVGFVRGIFDAWGPTGHASRGGIRVYFSPPLCMGRGGYSGLDSGFLMPS